MDIFGVLTMLGGLALFLYGMDLMGKSLERQAGNRLQTILERLTAKPAMGFLLGLAVTAVIQSSSATTVMVVGFVNSGLMKLHQACSVIMGANVGTTVTSWILSLSGIEGDSFFVQLLKPASFSPILALAGVGLHMFSKREKLKTTGSTLLGFAILMFGMDTMSGAVKPLADVPEFTNLFTLFSNPILGVLTGALLTAVLQSSSASVGILQALSATGAITFSSAIPIIMGQNIGTCVTALISSVGANRNARRTAFIHLYFNIIGVALFLSLYMLVNAIYPLPFSGDTINGMGVAIVHTCFNLLATAALLPFSRTLEKLACLTVPDGAQDEAVATLDERLINTPTVAVEQSRRVSVDMANDAHRAMIESMNLVGNYTAPGADSVQNLEDRLDRFEDVIGGYLVKLSSQELSDADSRSTSTLLHLIGDFERIGDHAVNIAEAAQELSDKKLTFSEPAVRELNVLRSAIEEILSLSISAFVKNDVHLASKVEPLEQVVDDLTKEMKRRHIERLQSGLCTIELGFILSDLTSNCERVADHCSNIAATLIESSQGSFGMHGYTGRITASFSFQHSYEEYVRKYSLVAEA
ncbi:MAG: Na/Pi cotransporter family protein [Clostridia bacterium]|nr:Na/Pi cotransporter family protein [Clostridia bacterium]